MRILLDEHISHELRPFLSIHEVFTVGYMGWQGLKNGELFDNASAHGFEVVITNDSGVEHEQNRATLPVSVLFLSALSNRIEDIRPLLPQILLALSTIRPRSFFD